MNALRRRADQRGEPCALHCRQIWASAFRFSYLKIRREICATVCIYAACLCGTRASCICIIQRLYTTSDEECWSAPLMPNPPPPHPLPSGWNNMTAWCVSAKRRSHLLCMHRRSEPGLSTTEWIPIKISSRVLFFFLQYSEGRLLLCGCNSFQRSKGEISYWNRYVTCIVIITHTTLPWAGVLSCLQLMLIK